MTFLKKLLASPVFDDEAKTREAKLLNYILWGLVIAPIPYLIYIVIKEPDFIERALTQFVFGETINIFLLWLLRHGNVRTASILQISFFWLFFTVTAFTGEGVNGKAYLLGYPLVILIAGALLGSRGALTVTGLGLASGGVMVVAQIQGWVEIVPITTSTATWIITLVVFPMLVLLQHLTGSELRDALSRAQTSEERYRLISEVSSDYAFSTELDAEGNMRLSWVAGAFEKITGFTYEEYMASGGWLAHLHPDEVEGDAESTAIIKTNQPVITEVRTIKKNGDIGWVRVYAQPAWDEKQGRVMGIVGAVQDITEQKKAEISLKHERDLLQVFMDNIPDQVYFKDVESRFIRVNKAQATFLGLSNLQDAIGKTDIDFQTPELARQFLEEEKQIIESGEAVINRVEFNPTEDGKPRWLSATKTPVWDPSGNLLGTIGISRDITEQKQIDAMLAYERDILQIFMDNIPDQVYFKDTESRFVRINQGQAKFLGIDDPQDAIGKTDFDFQPLEFAQEFMAEEKRIMETGQPVLSRVEFNPTRDGKPRWLSTSKVPAKNEFGHVIGTIGISIDITAQKLAEETEESRRKMLEKVLELGKRITEVSDMQTTLKRIWHAVREGLNFDRLGIFLYKPENNSVHGTYGTSQQGEMVDEWNLHISLDSETEEVLSFVRVLQEENGLYITHNYTDERKTPRGDIMYGVKDYAAVAMWAGEKPMGIVCVDNLITGRPITVNQLEALRLFAGYAGLAIENSRLKDAVQSELNEKKKTEETEQRRRQMLEKVVQLGKQVAEVSDLKTTLEKIWYALHEGLDFDRIGIFTYKAETNSINRMLGTDIDGNRDDTIGEPVLVTEWHSFQLALERPDGFYFTHDFSHEAKIPEGQEMYDVRDYATVAAWAGGKPVAVIAVDQLLTQRPITEQQLEALRLFAGYAGLAIENARLKDAIQNELDEKKQAEENGQRRRQTLEKVMRLGKQVTEVNDLRTTLRRIWHGVRSELDFDRVGLFTYNPQENNMIGAYGTDREGNIWDAWHVTFELDENSLFHKVLVQPNGFYFTTDYEKEFNLPPGHEMAGVKYVALVAVWAGNKPIALISVDQLLTGRPILEEQLEALRLFAGYAGLAISNSHLNDALQEELSHRQTFIDELEAKNAELERFTYTASHDLKSPLVTITGFLGYLEKDALAGNQERMKSSITRINSAAEKMQALLNDLLELSRIGRLMNPPEEVPFQEIVHEAIDRVRGRLDEINASVEVQRDFPVVHGDRIRLVEVVQNLIENAVKYARPGIIPYIEIGSNSISENGYPVFYVRDNGIGIDPPYHERIFGLFNKLDAQSEGTGIGLSLVKRIIEVHGGRVWVESEKGSGATFYFSLPTSQIKE